MYVFMYVRILDCVITVRNKYSSFKITPVFKEVGTAHDALHLHFKATLSNFRLNENGRQVVSPSPRT